MGRLDSLVTFVRLISHSSLQLMHKYVLYFYNQFVIFSMTVKRAFVSVREDH